MKLLYVDNMPAHYRKAIFCLMENEFEVEYLFGESRDGIRPMDTSLLHGKVKIAHIHSLFGGLYWQFGVIENVLRTFDCYILIGETRSLSTWVFCMLARLLGKSKKVYLWSHGWYGKETKEESFLKKIFFRLPGGGIFLYGNYARGLMIKEGFNPQKLFTIHNSLDYDKQVELRNKMRKDSVFVDHFGNTVHNLIFIGRLTRVKQLDLLLRAVDLCKKSGFPLNVTFIGDGSERINLEMLTHELGLDGYVWFYGACYNEEENARLLFNADLCVAPGNVGLTAMHSLVYGTPVLTHNDFSHQMPEFEAIHEGITGGFYEYGSVESMTNSIIQWFALHSDREEIRQLCYQEIDGQWTPQFQLEVLRYNLRHEC